MATETLPRGAAGLPDAPPVHRRWAGRISGGHLLVLVAGLTAAVANLAVLRGLDDRTPAVVAASDVPRGAVLAAADLTTAEVALPGAVAATLLDPAAAGDVVGWTAVTDLPAGAPLRAGDLRPPDAPEGRRAMSLPIDPAHAVGGDLAVGDRIDVIVSDGGQARYVARGVQVLAVAAAAEGGLDLGPAFSLTLAVDEDSALALAAALHAEGLEVVRAPEGAPGAEG